MSRLYIRVWDKRYGKYLGQREINNMLFSALNDNSYKIEQWTGLVDNDNNGIYEGDIVYYARDDENYLIDFDIVNAMYTIINYKETVNFDNLYSTELEVIGNINENKELLK